MDTTRTPAPSISLAVLLTAELAAIVALHQLGDLGWAQIDVSAPGVWLATTSAEDVILAAARLAGLACAYWLLVTTLASTVAAFRNTPSVIRALARTAPLAIRTLAEKAAVATVAGGAVLVSLPGLSAAAPPPPGVAPPGDVAPPAVSPMPTGDLVSPSASGEHVVVAGDNLWSIAAATVTDRVGTESVGEIAAYWLRLVEANRDVLRSGDPDLIFPGERIVLPD